MRTILRGERQGASKLSDKQRDKIAKRYLAGGVTQHGLGREYGVTHSTIAEIVTQYRRRRLLRWPPEIPGLETPDFLLSARGSFPPDEVIARAREAMRQDFPPTRRAKASGE